MQFFYFFTPLTKLPFSHTKSLILLKSLSLSPSLSLSLSLYVFHSFYLSWSVPLSVRVVPSVCVFFHLSFSLFLHFPLSSLVKQLSLQLFLSLSHTHTHTHCPFSHLDDVLFCPLTALEIGRSELYLFAHFGLGPTTLYFFSFSFSP